MNQRLNPTTSEKGKKRKCPRRPLLRKKRGFGTCDGPAPGGNEKKARSVGPEKKKKKESQFSPYKGVSATRYEGVEADIIWSEEGGRKGRGISPTSRKVTFSPERGESVLSLRKEKKGATLILSKFES